MVNGGYDCINRAGSVAPRYVYQLLPTINKSGKIISWCTYMHTAGTVGLRIYRLSGSQYLYIGGSTISCPSGHSSHTTSIDVQSGDIVGIYLSSGSIDCDVSYTDILRYKTVDTDVVSTTPTSGWETVNDIYTFSIGVIVSVDYYIKTDGDDTFNGKSWVNAWKTINKGATTVIDGDNVHIGFGTYDAEPSANKIAPQNIGSSGITYIFETSGSSGGTGTVTIEKN